MVMELEELFLSDCGAQRTISQRLWSSKNYFSTVIELKEWFLNGYGA
jgi:hypothetical protein